MSLNKYMHKRNIYKSKAINFEYLANKYPEFDKHVIRNASNKVFVDFKDCAALSALTIALLKEDFNLNVEIPADRLIPTVPLRLNYIHWIADIIGIEKKAKGIDIGTGSCCIYPILGCHIYDWSFLATEIDPTNSHYASNNISNNGFCEKIKIVETSGDTILTEVLNTEDDVYDFCMCNPPFFADSMDAQAITSTRSLNRPQPSSTNCAHPTESIVEGGEAKFIERLILESLSLKDRVRVFTSMVGKKSNIPHIKSVLKENQITNFGVTEFCQGKTMRWGIGWSFEEIQFPKSEFQINKQETQRAPLLYCLPNNLTTCAHEIGAVRDYISHILTAVLKIEHDIALCDTSVAAWNLRPDQNTWINQRRKRRSQQTQHLDEEQFKRPKSDIEGTEAPIRADISPSSLEVSQDDPKINTDIVDHNVPESCDREDGQRNLLILNESRLAELQTGIKTNEVQESAHMIGQNIGQISQTSESTVSDLIHNECESRTTEGKDRNQLFSCFMYLKKVENSLTIEFKWLEGTNRNDMYSLFQYFKNRLV